MKKSSFYKLIATFLLVISILCFYLGYSQVKSPILLALAFHDVSDDEKDFFSIKQDKLFSIIKKLQKHDYKAITPRQFESELLLASNQRKGRKFIVTFDDGRSESANAIRTLKTKFGISSALFIVLDLIGKPDYMDLSTIIDLKENYDCFIGLHGQRHVEVTKILEEKTDLTKELKTAREILGKLVNQEITWFSYPYGETNDEAKKSLKESGLHIAFNVLGGNIKENDDLLFINRIMYIKNAKEKGMPDPESWAPPYTVSNGTLTVTLSLLVGFLSINWFLNAKKAKINEMKKKQNNL